MSDYARALERAQILTALFWDGTITQEQIDVAAHAHLGLSESKDYDMSSPAKPDDWVPSGTVPPAERHVMVDFKEMVETFDKDGNMKLTPLEEPAAAKPAAPPPPPKPPAPHPEARRG